MVNIVAHDAEILLDKEKQRGGWFCNIKAIFEQQM